MDEAEEDILAYAILPAEQWQKVWSNSPLERLNKKVKRRTNVVEIFPTETAVIPLVGACSLSSKMNGRLEALLQRRIFSEAGAHGGDDSRAARVGNRVGAENRRTARAYLHTGQDRYSHNDGIQNGGIFACVCLCARFCCYKRREHKGASACGLTPRIIALI
jgi:hypothetical protein